VSRSNTFKRFEEKFDTLEPIKLSTNGEFSFEDFAFIEDGHAYVEEVEEDSYIVICRKTDKGRYLHNSIKEILKKKGIIDE